MKAAVLVATSCLFVSTARATPSWAIDIGPHIGGRDGAAGFGGTLGAGQRLCSSGLGSIWAHETVSATDLVGPLLFGHGSGTAFRGSAGFELQVATSPGSNAYFMLGLEAGYAQLDYEGVDDELFGGTRSVSYHDRGASGVFRIGVHLGGESVGFEPVLEFAGLGNGASTVEHGLNIVFGW